MNFTEWTKQNGKILFFLPAFFWAFTIMALSLIPQPPEPPFDVDHFDKIGHFAAYAVLAFLIMWGATRNGNSIGPEILLFALILSSAYGIVIEIFQYFIPGRHACAVDAVFNMAGAFFGVLAGRILLWRK